MMLTGLYIPLITPFDNTGSVALGALEALAHRVLDAGAAGIVALGTTAEPGSLSGPERRAVVDVAARVCRERDAHLVVGAHTADELRELRNRPEVRAALTLVPPFVRPGEAGVLAYFEHLAAASAVPLVVYDIPHRTGQYLPAAALRRLAGVPGVTGVKYAAGGINADTVELLADPPDRLAILGGDDPFIAPLLALGAHGGILATAHLATARFVALIAAWRGGDLATARALGGPLSTLSAALFAAPNPTVIKAVLHQRGEIPTAAVRLPLVPPHPDTVAAAVALDQSIARLDQASAPAPDRPPEHNR